MDQFIASLSRSTLALIAITAGILVILISNPLPTVCDSQYEHFEDKIRSILFIDRKMKVKPTQTRFAISFDNCRNSNNAGGCYDFFVNLKDVLRELDNTPPQCYADFGERTVIKETLWKSMELITRLAWGERIPASFQAAGGWLDNSNLAIVCELKDTITKFYSYGGKNPIANFARKTVPVLPGAAQIPFDRAWPLTILAKSCVGYR